ncbi:MAG: hypothetical protein ACFFCD_15520 [Promethearchaeota archaeon]
MRRRFSCPSSKGIMGANPRTLELIVELITNSVTYRRTIACGSHLIGKNSPIVVEIRCGFSAVRGIM